MPAFDSIKTFCNKNPKQAVIAAAIAAYRASEGMDATDASAFRVVSFRRATNGRSWNANR